MARPREFDMDTALRVAQRVFWEKGFDATSVTELAEAMGIVRPSLHAAFGTKEDLYRKALDLYGREAMAFIVDAIRGRSAYDVARLYLLGYCSMLSDSATPPGCFMINGFVAGGSGAPVARQECLERQKVFEGLFEERFRQAQQDGDLDPGVDVPELVEHLMTVANGLVVRADMGASSEELQRAAMTALKRVI